MPEIKLLYNRVGYEQVAPKRFTVWSNFPAQTGRLTLADLTGEVVFQAPLGDGERILGADGAMWEGYYYRGDFTNFEEEGAYTLAITLDASEPLAAEIQIGFNLLWEKAFLPAVQAFQRHRADNRSGDGVPRLWNDPGLNGAPDALLLWSLVYSWSLLRMRFAGEPPLTLLEQEAFYGADRVARWILQGNAEKLARHEECERYLNALSCIANYKQSGDEMLEAARQVLSLLMAEKRDGPWVFFAALDLYAATGEETWLVYAQEIYPGLTLERVESLLEYEAITSTLITIPLQHTFTEMMDQVIPRIADRDMAAPIQEYLEGLGIEFVMNSPVQSVNGEGRVSGVTAAGREYPCDMVVFATGVRANLDIPKMLGLDIGQLGGVIVSPTMQPYRRGRLVADVYLAGDMVQCQSAAVPGATMSQLGSTAVKQGIVAGRNAAGGTTAFGAVASPWVSVIGEKQIAGTGLSEGLAAWYGIEAVSGTSRGYTRARYYPGGRELMVKVIADRVSHRIIGAQIIAGEDATGRINWLTSAVIEGVTAEDFLVRAENAYCPPTSMVRDVVITAVEDLCARFLGCYRDEDGV